MEEDPIAKDPSAKPENYNSTETEDKELVDKKPEEKQEKKKETPSSSSNSNSSDGGKKVDFVSAIILSCLSFWLCGILFGGVAFILAVIGKYKADSGNQELAGRLKVSSLVLSIIGIVIGLAAGAAFLILYFTVWSKQTPIHG